MNNSSYKNILSTTLKIGGSQVISILLNVFKTKLIAVFIGPVGIGVVSIFQSIIDFTKTITGLGINQSAVKFIAENSEAESTNVDRKIDSVLLWSLITGFIGLLTLIIFSKVISKISFNDYSQSQNLVLLSIIIIIVSFSNAHLAILQGVRKINEIAKITIFGTILGLVFALPFYYFLKLNGIVYGIIFQSLGILLVSTFYYKRIFSNRVYLFKKKNFLDGLELFKLGFFLVISSSIVELTLYITRIYISQNGSLEDAGFFQASWSISKLYVGIILNSMMSDFFPRLSNENKDNTKSNILINEQLDVALMMGIPMVMIVFSFSNEIIYILYSKSFIGASQILRLQMIGTFFTFISWPLGVLLIARGKGLASFIINLIWSLVFIIIIILGWKFYGLQIVGYSFIVASITNFFTIYFSVRKISNFKLSRNCRNLIYVGLISMSIIYFDNLLFSKQINYLINSILIIITSTHSINKLLKIFKTN